MVEIPMSASFVVLVLKWAFKELTYLQDLLKPKQEQKWKKAKNMAVAERVASEHVRFQTMLMVSLAS